MTDDYGKLMAALNAFIRCPKCGSERAIFNIRAPHIEMAEPAQLQGECPECDYKTAWVDV